MFVIQTFQTLIVGILAIVGVMATLYANAWISRRQHTRQVEHEANVLRVAIRAELEAIRDELRDWIQTFDNPESSNHGFFLPLAGMTQVYDELLGKLGLLSEHEVRAVMYAYLPIRQLPERLKLVAKSELTLEDRARGAATREGAYGLALRRMHKSYLDGVEKALGVILV
jgi:hypothetical protein